MSTKQLKERIIKNLSEEFNLSDVGVEKLSKSLDEMREETLTEAKDKFVEVMNKTETFYGNPREEKMVYYDDVLEFLKSIKSLRK